MSVNVAKPKQKYSSTDEFKYTVSIPQKPKKNTQTYEIQSEAQGNIIEEAVPTFNLINTDDLELPAFAPDYVAEEKVKY